MSQKHTFAGIILQQLGGGKFIAMTGCSNFLQAEITETNPIPWLRMNLIRNSSKANRLKIFLNDMDTYTMYFYKQEMKNFEPVISMEQKFEGVYADMLQPIFNQVTGLDTSL